MYVRDFQDKQHVTTAGWGGRAPLSENLGICDLTSCTTAWRSLDSCTVTRLWQPVKGLGFDLLKMVIPGTGRVGTEIQKIHRLRHAHAPRVT